jgi:hypothetical protein
MTMTKEAKDSLKEKLKLRKFKLTFLQQGLLNELIDSFPSPSPSGEYEYPSTEKLIELLESIPKETLDKIVSDIDDMNFDGPTIEEYFNSFGNSKNQSGEWISVKVCSDGDGHWYIIPNELEDDFNNDLTNEDFCDSGSFDNKYGQYRTGGSINADQLYIKRQTS